VFILGTGGRLAARVMLHLLYLWRKSNQYLRDMRLAVLAGYEAGRALELWLIKHRFILSRMSCV